MGLFKCPNCGGIYLKDGKCETCGLLIDESKRDQQQQTVQKNHSDQSQVTLPKNLMRCPDCGQMISKDAYTCPRCGCPFPGNMPRAKNENRSSGRKSGTGILGTIVAIVVAALIIWYIAAPYSTPVWLQKIGGTIRCFFTGETSYQIFDPSKLGK